VKKLLSKWIPCYDAIKTIFKKEKVENNYGYIKFERGDVVKVTIYSEIPEFWYIGKILDINARYAVTSIQESWRVEYYVSFKNKNGDVLKYWFLESELKKYSLQEERNSIIEQILNNENTTNTR
jgi:hypothetical protein